MSTAVQLQSSDLVHNDVNKINEVDTEQADKYLEWWLKLWSKKDTAWHLDSIHPVLLKYMDRLLEGKSKENPARILLPLCGKSNDLRFLYQNGHIVTGVECAPQAIDDFFTLNNLPHQVREINGTRKGAKVNLHSTLDERLRVCQSNFLTLDSPETLNATIDCVWDRGAFGTITDEEQELYIKTIRRLLSDNFRYLLLVLEFDAEKSSDPVPLPQPEEKVRRMFGEFCNIEKLESKIPNHVSLYQKHMGAPLEVRETVYLMTPKNN